MMILPLFCYSYIFAAGYDFNKLAMLAQQRYGEEARGDILQLEQLLSQLKSASEAEKLAQINHFFNQKIMFADDIDVWGQSDYWASPLESIGLQAGDCEDFSIAKYVFLKAAGVSNDKLRLTYVRANYMYRNQLTVRAHMVLSYYATPQSEPLILDNLVPDISLASTRKDLSPIFSFNDKGLWVGNSSKPKSDSQTNLSKWRDVLNRMHADGIE
ncbi:MAG: transglutaminase-like cysteine peptidase [Methylotenera sp.]|nr:transglutaminase-like cysteine peptidase [Methylotenera sp.]